MKPSRPCSPRRRLNGLIHYTSAFIAALSFMTMTAARAEAQTGASVAASIIGTVTDATGGVLPGVTVTLKSPAIQAPQLIQISAADGTFRFSPLTNGIYEITYQMPGFNTNSRKDIELLAGFSMRLDAVLQIGVGEVIEVTGAAPVVDVVSTSSTHNLTSQTIKDTPVGRGLWELLSMTPGINVSAAPDVGDSQMGNRSDIMTYGVASTNTIAVEGVNTSIGPSSAVYQLSFSVAEVQIKTSGQTADVQSPGMNFQAVLKSGSNEFRGNYQVSYETPKLQAGNLTPELEAQGITVTNPLKYYYDFGIDLGGPIVRNKLWFYGAISKQARQGTVFGFNDRKLSSTRGADGKFFIYDEDTVPNSLKEIQTLSLKVSYQATTKHRILVVTQPTVKHEAQRNGTNLISLGSTVDYKNPGWTQKLELQSSLTDKTFFQINWGYGGYQTDYSANRTPYAVKGNPSITDSPTGFVFGASGNNAQRPDVRTNVSTSLTFFPTRGLKFLPGRHEMKVGMEYLYERAGGTTEDNGMYHGNYTITTDACQVDAANPNVWRFTINATTGAQVPTCGTTQLATGQPYIMRQIVFRSAYPNMAPTLETAYSAFLTDTWRVSPRMTVNWGVRYDRQHPYVPAQSNPPSPYYPTLFPGGSFDKVDGIGLWNDWVPRLGVAYDASGDGRTVVKGSWGLYTEKITDGFGGNYNLNSNKTATFRFKDIDGNRDYTPGIGEVDLSLTGPDFVSTTAGGTLPIPNLDLKTSRTGEATLSVEREIAHNLGVKLQYVYKETYGARVNITPGRPFEMWNQQFTRRDPGADGLLNTADDPLENGAPRMVTFYDYDPSLRATSFATTQSVNVPRDRRNFYNTYEVAMNKRMSNRWAMTASMWYTQNNANRTSLIQTPNDLIFDTDNTWRWAATMTGTYQGPFGVLISGYYQAKQCLPASQGGDACRGTRTYAFAAADPDGGPSLPSSTTITIPMESPNTRIGRSNHVVNLRASKEFKLGPSRRMNIDFDTFNVFNAATPTAISYATGPNFGRITSILDSRIARFGARFSF